MTSSGILLLNLGPMRVRMYIDQISSKLISGEIKMHILAGSIFLDSNVFSKELEDLNSFNYLFLHNKII